MIIIDTAEKSDLESMSKLLEQLFSIELDFSVDEHKQKRGLKLLLDNENASVLVARDNGKVVGMCSLQFVISTSEGCRVAILEDLIVDEAYRGNGIGLKLLRAAGDYCKVHGITRITLLADKDNFKAIDFYRFNGWKESNCIVLRRFL